MKLWESDVPGYRSEYPGEPPTITPYLLEQSEPHSAVIVLPGGGYGGRAQHEGEPVARWLNRIGCSAFVANYRVAPYKHPYPLTDAQRAIRLVRYHAKEWNIDPDKIGILGFSAGGHLASTASTHFDYGNAAAADPIDRMSSRPDAAILCYPVISFGEHRHHGSMVNLIGENPPDELRNGLSNELQITPGTPPTFLWHTADDGAVPVENSLMYASSLRRNGVPFELHIFPKGRHGLGLAEGDPHVSQWTELCEMWLKDIEFIGSLSVPSRSK
ncbi:alpha/beta hydrolase [Paenibacillus alkalitolerans]|uniref:alpha/beta hydrolase n=1 Tax=Paenibacillus alkalitolerans TaxID=2799335 RepID=UPI0018F330F5|nr:alpha/beta hydrolase [Paenibacillus alkalitolerans]